MGVVLQQAPVLSKSMWSYWLGHDETATGDAEGGLSPLPRFSAGGQEGNR